uniref:UDP-glycosyltransferase TURAN isoform X2 n=1 Tax=Rhizophora mucronata TaxID=61149 RepID=A0A2P2M0D1_RHIMU
MDLLLRRRLKELLNQYNCSTKKKRKFPVQIAIHVLSKSQLLNDASSYMPK